MPILTPILIATLGIISAGMHSACTHSTHRIAHTIQTIIASTFQLPCTYVIKKAITFTAFLHQNKATSILIGLATNCITIAINLLFFILIFFFVKYSVIFFGYIDSPFVKQSLIIELINNTIHQCVFALTAYLSNLLYAI